MGSGCLPPPVLLRLPLRASVADATSFSAAAGSAPAVCCGDDSASASWPFCVAASAKKKKMGKE